MRMTRQQNRKCIRIGTALTCIVVFVFALAAAGVLESLLSWQVVTLLILTFLTLMAAMLFLGVWGLLPHLRAIVRGNPRCAHAHWFVPELVD